MVIGDERKEGRKEGRWWKEGRKDNSESEEGWKVGRKQKEDSEGREQCKEGTQEQRNDGR